VRHRTRPARADARSCGVALAALIVLCGAPAARAVQAGEPAPLAEAPDSSIGFASVAEALAALKARKDVTVSDNRGWTIVVDKKELAVWSFAPPGHPAYPSAVRRKVIPRGEVSDVDMTVLCESSKAACDDLVRTFQALIPGQPAGPGRR
jgi:hypothetical protein